MSMDDMNNLIPESQEPTVTSPSLLTAEQSRRRFLRTAVIGTAGVAGAAGVAGVILSQRGTGPNLLTIASINGVSDGKITMLLEDTDCGTDGDASQCGDYTTTHVTLNSQGTSNPGSFFIVMAIPGLPADTYTITTQEKIDGAASYQNVPTTGTAALPFFLQGAGTQVYIYPAGTIGSHLPPYALNSSPFNGYTKTYNSTSFTTSATQDVLIFVHVNWYGGTLPGGSGTSEQVDFQMTLSGLVQGSVTETTHTIVDQS